MNIKLDLDPPGRDMGLKCDMLSCYVEQMWQIILKNVHIRESHSLDTTT